MTVVVGTVCVAWKVETGGALAWLRGAERMRQFAGTEVEYFAALETDARGEVPFQPLLDRLEELGGNWWTYQIDDGADEIGTVNRLVRICEGRNLIREYAQQLKAEAILYLDSDTAIPPEGLGKLLDVPNPIVGGRIPHYTHIDGKGPVAPDPRCRIHWTSAGCLLERREAYKLLPWSYDAQHEDDDGNEVILTDDPTHARLATMLGFQTWVRQDVLCEHEPLQRVEDRPGNRRIYRPQPPPAVLIPSVFVPPVPPIPVEFAQGLSNQPVIEVRESGHAPVSENPDSERLDEARARARMAVEASRVGRGLPPTVVVIPTIRKHGELGLLVREDLLTDETVTAIVILDNGHQEAGVRALKALEDENPRVLVFGDGGRLYGLWEHGLQHALDLSGGEDVNVLFLNDDIRLPALGTAEILAKRLRGDWRLWITYPDYNAAVAGRRISGIEQLPVRYTAGTYKDGGMCGWAWMLKGEARTKGGLPALDGGGFEWWCGDDYVAHLVHGQGYEQGRVVGLPVHHEGEGTSSLPEFRDRTEAMKQRDRDRYRELFGRNL